MGRATFVAVWLGQGIEKGSWNLNILPTEWAVGQKDVREEGQIYQDNGDENWRVG
jgi:hypothetical protein